MMQIEPLQEQLRTELQAEYQLKFDGLREDLRLNPTKRRIIRQHSAMIDDFIQRIWNMGKQHLGKLPKMSLMATGGYGRSEMFFYSDVDLMFLVDAGKKKQAEPLINLVLYVLWDLKLKVGHSVREVNEAISESKDDITIRTNLLEARHIAGSRILSKEFSHAYQAQVIKGYEQEFIESKLEEWSARHEKFGDSRALLEPNIKEGKGGHRDLQTLMWMMRACYGVRKMGEIASLGKISKQELRDFRQARKFLQLVRLHLHDFSNRAQERLNFDAQREIAERFDYRSGESPNQAVERFMKRYFQVTRTVGQLTRTLCFLLEAEWGKAPRNAMKSLWKSQQLPKGLVLEGNRLQFSDFSYVVEHPELMLAIFWYSHRFEIDVHPAAWQFITRNLKLIDRTVRKNKIANDYFLQLLLDAKNPAHALKQMNESGLLGKFIPDFGLLVGQMQFDLYHTFTVDEHILSGIGYLHKLESGGMIEQCELGTTLFPRIQMRRVVYLALFCHDIAKGRGGDHHLKGMAIARKLAKRFGFEKEEISALIWLVENHQHMSMTSFKRDLDDPQTITDFAAEVQSLQRLKMLYVLTVADIHAVAPNIWNSWKGLLLERLYLKIEQELGGALSKAVASAQPDENELRKALIELLPQIDPKDVEVYLENSDDSLRESYDIETHSRIFPCWHSVYEGDNLAIKFKTITEQSMTNVTIATRDKQGLFAQLSGVFAICGANITDARIHTLSDGIVIDRFAIQDEQGEPFSEDRRQDRIKSRLIKVLNGEIDLSQAVEESQKRYPEIVSAFELQTEVIIDNEASSTATLIEVHCLDRRGLLYELAECLASLKLSVQTAHITTYGEKVVDVFYVKNSENTKLRNIKKCEDVRHALIKIVDRE